MRIQFLKLMATIVSIVAAFSLGWYLRNYGTPSWIENKIYDGPRPISHSSQCSSGSQSSNIFFQVKAARRNSVQTAGSFKMPVMWVCSDGKSGSCTDLTFSYSRSTNGTPIRVSISENMAFGGGDMIRGAVWQSIIAAAMMTGDTLDGFDVKIDFDGRVDGPSLGAVSCLAMLSAMSGKTIPADFAMTGTIYPDGTVGIVGGVCHKIRAAAKAGKKRICIPAFRRFEEGESSRAEGSEPIDLMGLGEELGVEIRPVKSIEEVYAYVYGESLSFRPMPFDKPDFRMPHEPEAALISEYHSSISNIIRLIREDAARVNSEVMKDRYLSSLLKDWRFEQYFVSGSILSSCYRADACEDGWNGVGFLMGWDDDQKKKRNGLVMQPPFVLGLGRKKFIASLEELYEELYCVATNAYKTVCDVRYKPSCAGEMYGIQDAYDFGEVVRATAYLSVHADKDDKGHFASLSDDALSGIYNDCRRAAFLMKIAPVREDSFRKLASNVYERLQFVDMCGDVKLVHQLFCNAGATSIGNMVVGMRDKALSVGLVGLDEFIYCGLETRRLMSVASEGAGELSTNRYNVGVAVMQTARLLAKEWAMLLRVAPDSARSLTAAGTHTQGNVVFLGRVARRARKSAAHAIRDCMASGIPCLGAVRDFEDADADFVDRNRDIVDTIERFWSAELKARALIMLFGPVDSKMK